MQTVARAKTACIALVTLAGAGCGGGSDESSDAGMTGETGGKSAEQSALTAEAKVGVHIPRSAVTVVSCWGIS